MESEIKVGQRFKFNLLSDSPSPERQAVVTRVLSNREEGLGPEVDYYLAYWVEAYELPETEIPTALVFERGIDGMRSAISTTAKYGSALSGPELVNASTRQQLTEILRRIESGKFGKLFLEEAAQGSPAINELLLTEKHSRLARTGRQLQESLDF